MKNWDETRCFVRQGKVIYGKGEEDILGQEKVILLAGEVIYMGQERLIRWDRRG